MKKSENKESFRKKSLGNMLLSIFAVLTSLGGIFLYVLGLIGENLVCKRAAVLCFAVYFGAAGLFCLKKQKKAAVLFFVFSIALIFLMLCL